jgi:diadenosine tetraphosphate (Ap4A) HIT family hydrolase
VTCALCVEPPGDLVYEDERTRVVLHEDRSPRGHAMIIAKRHAENASDLDEDEWLHLARVWHRAERAILDATGADRAIILKLGILTPHLHVHIYPVSATATRAEVFDAIDGKAGAERDGELVERVRQAMNKFPLPAAASSRWGEG